jgi:hypothetical protein
VGRKSGSEDQAQINLAAAGADARGQSASIFRRPSPDQHACAQRVQLLMMREYQPTRPCSYVDPTDWAREREREQRKKWGKSSSTLIHKLSPYTLSVYIALCTLSMSSAAVYLWYIMDTLESISVSDRKYFEFLLPLVLLEFSCKLCLLELIGLFLPQ